VAFDPVERLWRTTPTSLDAFIENEISRLVVSNDRKKFYLNEAVSSTGWSLIVAPTVEYEKELLELIKKHDVAHSFEDLHRRLADVWVEYRVSHMSNEKIASVESHLDNLYKLGQLWAKEEIAGDPEIRSLNSTVTPLEGKTNHADVVKRLVAKYVRWLDSLRYSPELFRASLGSFDKKSISEAEKAIIRALSKTIETFKTLVDIWPSPLVAIAVGPGTTSATILEYLKMKDPSIIQVYLKYHRK
jgi:hypothetical protein